MKECSRGKVSVLLGVSLGDGELSMTSMSIQWAPCSLGSYCPEVWHTLLMSHVPWNLCCFPIHLLWLVLRLRQLFSPRKPTAFLREPRGTKSGRVLRLARARFTFPAETNVGSRLRLLYKPIISQLWFCSRSSKFFSVQMKQFHAAVKFPFVWLWWWASVITVSQHSITLLSLPRIPWWLRCCLLLYIV